jgi:uncharacterized membrane protein
MAGIGLRLQQLTRKDSFTHSGVAYASTAVIVAGPWLTTVASLALLGLTTAPFLEPDESTFMYATITYVFAASLLVIGGPQMVVTRFLADRLYEEDSDAVGPTGTGVVIAGSAALFAAASPFLLRAPFDATYRTLVVSLFVTACLIWMLMAFLSAARDYTGIVLAFLLGHAAGFAAASWLVRDHGVTGALLGFTVGQIGCLVLLLDQMFREFPSPRAVQLSFLRYFHRFWKLFLVGALYNLGIWADKIILWFSDYGQQVAGFYRVYPPYDFAMLMGYLSTVPGSIVFFIHVETNFHHHYRAFYSLIESRASLDQITAAKEGMVEAARNGLIAVAKVQGVVVLAGMMFGPALAMQLGMPAEYASLVRTGILAGNCQFIALSALVLLLYLDQRTPALRSMLMLAAGNIAFTLAALWLLPEWPGIGYLTAAALAALLALYYLRNRLEQLEYLVFMLQPNPSVAQASS